MAEIGRPTQKQKVDYTFKMLVIGDSGVGKSSVTRRFVADSFLPTPVSNVGLDLQVSKVMRNKTLVELQIWDTAGQERFRAITISFFRGTLGFVLLYDVTNEASFLAVRDWLTQMKRHAWDGSHVVLVGNKMDREDRVVSAEDGRQLAKQLGMAFFETSAKQNLNIDAVFEHLVDAILDNMNASLEDSLKSSLGDVDLDDTEKARCPKCNS